MKKRCPRLPAVRLVSTVLILALLGTISVVVQSESVSASHAAPVSAALIPRSSGTGQAFSVQVDQPIALKLENGPTKPWYQDILPQIISGLSGLIGALIGGWIGQKNSIAAINQKANEAELKEIQAKLEGFYEPFRQRSDEGKLLALELRNRQPDSQTFRTLLKLLDPNWLRSASVADQTIVAEIVENGLSLRTLIRDKAGAVDPAVAPYLARAATHYTMLKLAKEGALDNDPVRFERYVFPSKLDEVLQLEIQRLRARADLLQSKPSNAHSPPVSLRLPSHLALSPWPEPPRV